MKNCQILIVDQRRKSREELRSDIMALGPQFSATAVPSGEEALLEIRIQNYDILVSNIRLPGMDGVELMAKARHLSPALKVILIKQSADGKISSESACEDADAVLPMAEDPTDLLDAIGRCLDIEKLSPPAPPDQQAGKEGQGVDERLAALHNALGPSTSVLLDSLGRIHAQIGEFTDPRVVPPIMAANSANQRVKRYLGSEGPGDIHYFTGSDYDIFLASVGVSFLLVIFVEPIHSKGNLGKFFEMISDGARDLMDNSGVEKESEEMPISEDQKEDESDDDPEVEEHFLDAILQETEKNIPEPDDVEAFWESVAQGETDSIPQDKDVLTYDQAVELGLGPEDGNE